MKKPTVRRTSRLKTAGAMGQILGIEIFADTQILRVAVIAARSSAVGSKDFEYTDDDVGFPLADLDDPDVSNVTIMVVALRVHPGEAITGAVQFRYRHRGSMSDRALDLRR